MAEELCYVIINIINKYTSYVFFDKDGNKVYDSKLGSIDIEALSLKE